MIAPPVCAVITERTRTGHPAALRLVAADEVSVTCDPEDRALAYHVSGFTHPVDPADVVVLRYERLDGKPA